MYPSKCTIPVHPAARDGSTHVLFVYEGAVHAGEMPSALRLGFALGENGNARQGRTLGINWDRSRCRSL